MSTPLSAVLQCAGKPLVDDMVAHYAAIQQRLQGRQGQLVVVPYELDDRRRYGGTPRESDSRTVQHFVVGVFTGEQLVVAEDSSCLTAIALPVREAVHVRLPTVLDAATLVVTKHTETLSEWICPPEVVGWFVVGTQPVLHPELIPLHLHIGDDAVRRWIEETLAAWLELNDRGVDWCLNELCRLARRLTLTAPSAD